VKSDLPIDIVFCAIDKDYDILVHAIDSARHYIKHPISDIYIISPVSDRIKKICGEKNCVLIDENKVLPLTVKDINYVVNETNRSGWLFQQLLKWEAGKYTKNSHYLVTEADTIFCRPRVFEQEGKIIFPVSSYPCHIPYFKAIKNLIGLTILPLMNLTSHHALYSKKILANLKKDIEGHCKTKWYQAIIDRADRNEGSAVSDYESYGQYAFFKYPSQCRPEHWGNIHFGRSEVDKIKQYQKKYSKDYKAISFHSYDE
jgi:hypothetical protein